MNKYHAVKTQVNGYTFDSKREAIRYNELLLLVRDGQISNLEVHPVFPLVVNDKLICKYEADFGYTENDKQVVEDVKGFRTDTYKLKQKLMYAVYNISVVEVK